MLRVALILAGTVFSSMALLPLSSYTGFSSFSFLGFSVVLLLELELEVAGFEVVVVVVLALEVAGLLADWLLAGLLAVELDWAGLLALVAGLPVLAEGLLALLEELLALVAGLLAVEPDWTGLLALVAGFPVLEEDLLALLEELLVAGLLALVAGFPVLLDAVALLEDALLLLLAVVGFGAALGSTTDLASLSKLAGSCRSFRVPTSLKVRIEGS